MIILYFCDLQSVWQKNVSVPDPPYDVMGVWTDKNGLNVSWKHPNNTNGKVTNFTLNIANGKSKSLPVEIGSEEKYNLTYTYTVNIFQFSWTEYLFIHVWNKIRHDENFVTQSFLFCKQETKREDTDFPKSPNVFYEKCLFYLQIEKKKFAPNPCRELDVSITVSNEKYFTKSRVIKVFSPPAEPNISNSKIQISNDTNQNVFIILPTMTGKSLQSENNTYYILSTSSRDEESIRKELKLFETAVKKGSEPTFTHLKKHDSGSQENLSAEKTITINSTHHSNIYRLYIYFVNRCGGKVELQMVERNPFSLEPIDSNKGIYALILLIFLIPLVVYVYV